MSNNRIKFVFFLSNLLGEVSGSFDFAQEMISFAEEFSEELGKYPYKVIIVSNKFNKKDMMELSSLVKIRALKNPFKDFTCESRPFSFRGQLFTVNKFYNE